MPKVPHAATGHPPLTRSIDDTTAIPQDLYAAMLELGHVARARSRHVLVLNQDQDGKGKVSAELVLCDLCVLNGP